MSWRRVSYLLWTEGQSGEWKYLLLVRAPLTMSRE